MRRSVSLPDLALRDLRKADPRQMVRHAGPSGYWLGSQRLAVDDILVVQLNNGEVLPLAFVETATDRRNSRLLAMRF